MDNHTDVADMPDITISEAGIYQLLTNTKLTAYHPIF